jgi:hypothetical protein
MTRAADGGTWVVVLGMAALAGVVLALLARQVLLSRTPPCFGVEGRRAQLACAALRDQRL